MEETLSSELLTGSTWMHTKEKKTVLRDVFTKEMRDLDPEWAGVFDANDLQRDYGSAVQYVDIMLWGSEIQERIGEVVSGNKSPDSLRAQ